jgi:protein ImuB
MTLAEATSILKNKGKNKTIPGRRPQRALHIYEHDPTADRTALEQIATECHQFSPLVGLEATAEPSSLLLDVTGSAPRLGGEQTVAQHIADFIQQLGCDSRVAVAHTVGAAWAFAHTTADITIVPTKQIMVELARLPIESLRLPSSIRDLLAQLGVRHVSELFQLPRESLHARFGPELLLRMDQATGRTAEAIITHSPAPPLTVTRQLEHATARRDAMEHLTRDLVGQLCRNLAEQDREAVQLEYTLTLTSQTTTNICVGLYQATANPQHIFGLLQMQLESTLISSPVQQATLKATIAVDRADEQHHLFDADNSPAPRQLAHLIERLSSRLGADRVVAAYLSREPQIELAYHYRSLAGKRVRTQNTSPNQNTVSYTRPLLLIHPPVPLQVVGVHRVAETDGVAGTTRVAEIGEPTRASGPPASFLYRNESHRTIAHWGPERIETGWWRGPTIRRDYYRIEDERGGRFWLFHDLRQQRWFLHGEFE